MEGRVISYGIRNHLGFPAFLGAHAHLGGRLFARPEGRFFVTEIKVPEAFAHHVLLRSERIAFEVYLGGKNGYPLTQIQHVRPCPNVGDYVLVGEPPMELIKAYTGAGLLLWRLSPAARPNDIDILMGNTPGDDTNLSLLFGVRDEKNDNNPLLTACREFHEESAELFLHHTQFDSTHPTIRHVIAGRPAAGAAAGAVLRAVPHDVLSMPSSGVPGSVF